MTGGARLALLATVAGLLGTACGGRGGDLPRDGAAPPAAPGTFEDATPAAGIRFEHVNGATGRKFMLETLGSGACVFDYDGDGRLDVYFVQGGRLPGSGPEARPGAALYRNAGVGRFTDVTATAGVGGADRYGFGCVAGDIDGDGDRDLFVTCYGPDLLYRNRGDGTFAEAAAGAGVSDPLWSTSAGMADADGDSDLDLYVANYVEFALENHLYCGENRPGYRTVCHPKNYDSQPDAFYRNRGDGTFENATSPAGVADRDGKGLGVVWGDYDDDGDQDIYVANDDTPNFLWRNRGNGTFDEVAGPAGVALSEDGVPQAGMGTDMADYDGDGRLDIVVTNLSEETNELYHNDGGGLFSDRTFVSGLGAPSLLFLGFGTFFFDPDHDGDLDLFVANGHIIDNIGLYSDTITFEQPIHLYRNLGGGRFAPPDESWGDPFRGRYVGRGALPFDFDDDGDEDILMTQNGRPAVLLRAAGPPRGHWVTLTLAGRPPNRDAIGARVTLEAGGRRQVRYARTAMSYLSQGDPRIHFGLGNAASVDRVLVRWPGRGGAVEEFPGVGADRFTTLREGEGRRSSGGVSAAAPGDR